MSKTTFTTRLDEPDDPATQGLPQSSSHCVADQYNYDEQNLNSSSLKRPQPPPNFPHCSYSDQRISCEHNSLTDDSLVNTFTIGQYNYSGRYEPERELVVHNTDQEPFFKQEGVFGQDDILHPSIENPCLVPTSDKVPCPQCSVVLRDERSLRRHISRKHNPNIDWYHCRDCDYNTTKKADLERHVRSKHPVGLDPKPFKCRFCGIGSSRADNLRRHITNRHSQDVATSNSENGVRQRFPGYFEPNSGSHIDRDSVTAFSSPAPGTSPPERRQGSREMRMTDFSVPSPLPDTLRLVTWASPDSRQARKAQLERASIERVVTSLSGDNISDHPQSPLTLAAVSGLNFENGICSSDKTIWGEFESRGMQETCEAESSTVRSVQTRTSKTQQPRKRRTEAEHEARWAKRRREEDDDDDDDRKSKSSVQPGRKEYDHRLLCPFHDYDPNRFNDISCTKTIRQLSHLCEHLRRKHGLYYESRYIAHVPISDRWPWPDVAAGVCRKCYRTFQVKTELNGHVTAGCQNSGSLEGEERSGVQWKWRVLKQAFCDDYFRRLPQSGSSQQAQRAQESQSEQPNHRSNQRQAQLSDPSPDRPSDTFPNQPLDRYPDQNSQTPTSPSSLELLVKEHDVAASLIPISEHQASLDRESTYRTEINRLEDGLRTAKAEVARIPRLEADLAELRATLAMFQPAIDMIQAQAVQRASEQRTGGTSEQRMGAASERRTGAARKAAAEDSTVLNGVMPRDFNTPPPTSHFNIDVEKAQQTVHDGSLAQRIRHAPQEPAALPPDNRDPPPASEFNDSGLGLSEINTDSNIEDDDPFGLQREPILPPDWDLDEVLFDDNPKTENGLRSNFGD